MYNEIKRSKIFNIPVGKFQLGITHIVLLLIMLVWIYPFVWIITASLKTQNDFFADRLRLIPRHITFDNIIRVWTSGKFGLYFLNTVIVTVSVVIIVVLTTALSGYVLGRYRFPGRKIIFTILLASIAIPIVTRIIPTYEIIKAMGLLGTRVGLILVMAGGGQVIFVLLFSGNFASMPIELEEAAYIDGCGFVRLFFSVFFPLSRPIAVTVIIMQFIWAWNAFLMPLVLTLNNPKARTLAVGLYSFKGENVIDWTGIAAGSAISVLPIIIVFLILQKYFVSGIAGALKG